MELPIGALIAIIIVSTVLALWLLIIAVDVIFSCVFSRKIKHGNVAVNLLLKQRYEIMMEFISTLKQKEISISDEDKKAIDGFERIEDFQNLKKDIRDAKVLNFVHAAHNIDLLAKKNEENLGDSVYKDLAIRYWEIEESYRQKSALYNADIIGYNYWISTFFSAFIFKLAKKTKKDLIV